MVGDRRAKRYPFDAIAEVEHCAVVRLARVKDLCINGCYLAMPEPFSQGAPVRIKIRTDVEFFLADGTVAHSTHGLGMGVMFHAISPPFLIVLQYWLSEAQQKITRHNVDSKELDAGVGFAMKNKKPYTPPSMVQYLPDQVPKRILDSFNDDSLSVAPTYTTVIDDDRRYVQVSEGFGELLGYKSEELIGKRFDEVSAPSMSDIPDGFSMFKTLGRMQGFWMLVDRTGQRILIRYEAWTRPDSFIESNIEVVDRLG